MSGSEKLNINRRGEPSVISFVMANLFFLKNTFFYGCKITEFTGIVLLNPSN